MKYIRIEIKCGGDCTRFIMKVNKEQLEFIDEVSKVSQLTSTYGGMPIIEYEILEVK